MVIKISCFELVSSMLVQYNSAQVDERKILPLSINLKVIILIVHYNQGM